MGWCQTFNATPRRAISSKDVCNHEPPTHLWLAVLQRRFGRATHKPFFLFLALHPPFHSDQVLQHLSSHNVTKSFSCLPVSSSTPRSPSRRLPRSSVWKSIRPSSVSTTATFPFPPAASPKPLTKSNFQHYITMLTKCVLLWVFPCVYGELFVC